MRSDWPEYTIDDLKAQFKSAIAMGPFGSRIKSENFVTEGVPIIKGGQLHGTYVSDSKFDYLTLEKAEELKTSQAVRGDLVITHRGTLGQVSLIPNDSKYEKYIVSQSQLKVSLDTKKVNPYFVNYFFRSHLGQHRLLLNSSQVGVPAISKASTSVKQILVPCPSLKEQNAVVVFLKMLDDKIELNRQMNDTLESMAQALFKSWFVDFDPVIDNALAAGNAIPDVFADRAEQRKTQTSKDSSFNASQNEHQSLFPSEFEFTEEMGWIPLGWELSNIEQEFDVTMGQSPPGSTYNENGDGIFFYQGSTDFGFRYPSPRIYCSEPKRLASKNDTLVSVRAPVGDTNIALTDCCIGRGLAAIRHKTGGASFTYYSMLQLKENFKIYEGEGTVFGSINQKDFKSLKQLNVAAEAVNHFELIVGGWDKKIELNELQIQNLTKLRDTLLPKLLSGELRIPDAEKLISEII